MTFTPEFLEDIREYQPKLPVPNGDNLLFFAMMINTDDQLPPYQKDISLTDLAKINGTLKILSVTTNKDGNPVTFNSLTLGSKLIEDYNPIQTIEEQKGFYSWIVAAPLQSVSQKTTTIIIHELTKENGWSHDPNNYNVMYVGNDNNR